MMKIDKKNINKYMSMLIIMLPIIDLITSLQVKLTNVDFSLGMIIKSIFLLIALIYIIFFSNKKQENYKKNIIYLSILGIYVIAYMLTCYTYEGNIYMFHELKSIVKVIYFPVLLIVFRDIMKNKLIDIRSYCFVVVVAIYSSIILIAQLTGTQFISYESGKLGHAGWFYSPNEIGAIIAMLSPLVIYGAILKRKKLWYYLLYMLLLYSSFIIGTKTPFLGVLLSILGFIVIYLIKMKIENKKYMSTIFAPLAVIAIGVILIVPNTPVGYNLKLHLNWLQISDLSDIYKDNDDSKIINLIFSSRDKYLLNVKEKYKNLSVSEKLFGMGYVDEDTGSMSLIEIDYYDIYYGNGFIGFLVIMYPLILLLFNILSKFYGHFKKAICNLDVVKYSISLILALLIAGFAGHVLIAPSVSIFIVFILVKLEKEMNELVKEN